jgi:hypothetical protein
LPALQIRSNIYPRNSAKLRSATDFDCGVKRGNKRLTVDVEFTGAGHPV